MSIAQPVQPTTTLSRGIDYLGDLGAKLRDLQGDRTLAHELIQNADDAPTASWMCFDVTQEALVVDNDGTFSDCKAVEAPECPWKHDPKLGYRCDFHRIRNIASGDKRAEPNTTGAFGIGFLTVYQITDSPEILSSGRHWRLHEERPEDERIEVCHGCSACQSSKLPGTRFVLPWARSASTLRQKLQLDPVQEHRPSQILGHLLEAIPVAMLFLKRLRAIDIKADGKRKGSFQRVDEGDSLILSAGGQATDQLWHLVRGDFSDAANNLRELHPAQIEKKRRSEVTIAIPLHRIPTGLLCACLPTEHEVALPFYVNADFFPSNDRKHVLLADDYQSDWNRQALRAAAHAIANRIGELTSLLGPKRFWELLATIKETADAADRGGAEPTLSQFWKQVEPRLKGAATVHTSSSTWVKPSEAYFLLQKEEASAIPLLEGLGLHVVHEDLRPYQNLLRAESVGVPLIDIPVLCHALKSQGLTKPTELVALTPEILRRTKQRANLWTEISRLLDRQRTPRLRSEAEQLLRTTAIAPGRGKLWPCGEIFYADEATVALFEELQLDIPFVVNEPAFAPLLTICRHFDAAAAIKLFATKTERLEIAWNAGHLPLPRIFSWLEDRRSQILEHAETKRSLANLRIFPSSGRLCALQDVALAGDFDDPLGLAQLIDLASLGGRREFLRDLEAPVLDFLKYATSHLPAALNQPDVPNEKRRMAVLLLAEQAGKLRDQGETIAALRATTLVECEDSKFRRPDECYFNNASVRECLRDVPYAVLPKQSEQSVHDLYRMLGVSEAPRLRDILNEINRLSREQHSTSATIRIEKIVAYLSKWLERTNSPTQLAPLHGTPWLPARGKADRWYRPTELYASYQKELFESQALFLDLPIEVQRSANQLLAAIGVNLAPPVELVVKHLKHGVAQGAPVHSSVYRFLNDKAGDPAINILKKSRCLWLDSEYKSPQQVFWSDHRFGRYRWRLNDDLRSYHKLLTQLEVKESPNAEDALKVLEEISKEFGATNSPLDDEANAVLIACWQLLEEALEQTPTLADKVKALRSAKCVPNVDRVLYPPEWVFFENRAGLAEKFEGFLTKNVIAKPIGAAIVLSTAGVRPLGSAVHLELLECDDPADDLRMMELIEERRNEIGRVLESQNSGMQTVAALSRLQSITCRVVASLVLRYRVYAFNRELTSPAEEVPALYDRHQGALFYTKRDDRIPWSAIARELAIALFPDEDPGRFAAGLKEVLAQESAVEAGKVLDELGFARLDTTVQEAPQAARAGGRLGTEEPAQQLEDVPAPTMSTGDGLSAEDAIRQILGPNANAPAPTPPIADPVPEIGTSHNGSSGKAQLTKAKKRPVLRSYVPSPTESDHEPPENQNGNGRSPVDIAGVHRVMQYESSVGRYPKEMAHNNKGYDIESRDVHGTTVLRYIEVKSFSGDWDSTYADLSRDQFDKANEEREKFWLYVVERAESENFRLHRIQNPARKANHFMFDDGWRATAEADPPESSQTPEPSVEVRSD